MTSDTTSAGGRPTSELLATLTALVESVLLPFDALADALNEFGQLMTGVRVKKDTGPLSAGDVNNLASVLKGESPTDLRQALEWHVANGVYMAYTAYGGFSLLTRTKADGLFLLNMDEGLMVQDHCLAEYRETVIKLAEKLGVDVAPICIAALTRGLLGGVVAETRHCLRTMKLIARDGRECVISMDMAPYGAHFTDTQYFLSGWDQQESPPLYFLCQLPHACQSVAEARESLMPDSVRKAISLGKQVRRQGDLFAIRTDLTADQLPGARMDGGGRIYGTSHFAPITFTLDTGQVFASQALKHDPRLNGEIRPPDHADCPLDEGLWAIVPNTVPKNKGARRQPQSW